MAKQVQAFEANDGTHWNTLQEAVSHELTVYLDALCSDGMIATRVLALKLAEPKTRQDVANLLNQLG